MEEKVQSAQRLAHLILQWHQSYGRERLHQLPPAVAQQYLARLDYFQARQISQQEIVQELVEEQIKGVFEHFYSEKIPSSLLDQSAQNIPHESLGDLALFIRQLLKEDAEERIQETPLMFTLSEGRQTQPTLLHPSFIQLPQKRGETARQTLRAYFQSLAEMEDAGVGGRELMVAMNEDLLEQGNRSRVERFVPAYHPASFDFQLATGENSLVSHILQGTITIVEVVLGSFPDKEALQEQET
jgi:hypothetical protein